MRRKVDGHRRKGKLAPAAPDTSLETILAALRDHLAPKPPELARRYEFHRRDQAPSESAAAYLAALRTTAQHCSFNDLDTALRDRFVFGLQNDTVKRRLLAKKEMSLTSAVEETVAAGAITREGCFTSPQSTSALRVEPVQHGTTSDDNEQGASEDVLRLPAGPNQQRGVERLSMQGMRKNRAHCLSLPGQWQSGLRRSPEADSRTQRSRNAPRTNMAYCDDLAVTAINAVSQPAKKKVHVDVTNEGAQCQMEVDSGSTYSIISDSTARRIFPKGCVPNLQPLDIILRDYQANRITVRGLATIAEPLHRLLDKVPWVWETSQQIAFDHVKTLLASNQVLTHFDEKKPIILACDASPYGIGEVLSHKMPDGREAPIAFYSRTLSSAERNYAQIDKEALAVVAGVKKFHDYVFGCPFQIYTDHKPLLRLFTSDWQTPQMLSPRMLRWSIFLNGYQHTLLHRPGKQMSHADGLSRLPLMHQCQDNPSSAKVVMLLDELPESAVHADDVAQYSAKDGVPSRVLSWVWRGWPRFTEALPAPRTFQPEDPVFARNYSQGPPWVPAVISRATGPISYEVVLPDGRVYRRHVDQLRHRSSSPIRVAETVPAGQPEVRPASSPSHGEMSRSETEDNSEPEEPPTAMPPSDDVATPQPAPPEESVESPGPRRLQRSRKTPQHLRDFVLALADC
ncbi:hypothetical protein MTO96_022403 [Rhipicephalus appendiculatus]